MSANHGGFEDGWTDRFLSRRSVLRGGLLGGAGLAAAALIGCGDDDDDDDSAPAGGGAAATAAGGQSTPAPTTGDIKRGGTFRDAKFFSITDVPDPHTSTAIAWVTWTWMGEAAVQWSNDATEILPVLVESWEYSPDGLELTLNVREGVKWHNKPPVDGRAFDAEDVAYNLTRIAGKLGLAIDEGKVFHRKSGLVGMIDAVPVDNRTVKVSFEFPSSPFMAGLTNGRNGLAPREFPEQVPFDYGTIVGTGAWVLDSFSNEEKAVFTANPDYWREGQPYMDSVEWLWVPDRVTTQVAFSQGQIEWVAASTPAARANVEKLAEDPVLIAFPFNSWNHVKFNATRPPFTDPRVRRAVHLVIDRHVLGDAQLGQGFYDITGPIASGFRDAIKVPELETLPGWRREKGEDIAEAKRLLDAAGFPNGELDFGILASATAASVEVPVRVIDMLQTVWPDMQPAVDQAGDNASFGQRQGKAEFDVVSYTNFAEGDAVLDAQTQMHTDGGRNYGKFSDPKTDELVEKALRQIDDEERRETLLELQHYIIEEQMPAAPTYIAYAAAYQQPWVRGFEPTGPSGGSVNFDYGREAYKIWLDK